MANRTINDEIEIMIDYKLKKIPYPLKCRILKVYADNFVDVETDSGELKYIKCIGANIIEGGIGVVIFLGGGTDDVIIIT